MKNFTTAIFRFAFCAAFPLAAAFAAPDAAGKISSLQGKAQIFENGRWAPASVGSIIYPTSSIQTGYNSRVILTLRNGGQLSLKANTTISFNELASGKQGNTVEVHLANGGLNSFVPKADEGKMNMFKVRTATAVAGVRGSFIGARRHGQHFTVNALHSPAFLEPAPAPSEKEIIRATLLNAVAKQEAGALEASEAKACMQKQDGQADSARVRLEGAVSKAREVNDRVSALKLVSDRQNATQTIGELREKIAEKDDQLRTKPDTDGAARGSRDVQAIREEIKQLEARGNEQQAKLEGINRSLAIAEGNAAQTQGMRVINPLQMELQKMRPQQANMPGQTRQEGLFMFNNMDNQAGMGNDFQRLFNNINRFNQQGTLVVPVLRKF